MNRSTAGILAIAVALLMAPAVAQKLSEADTMLESARQKETLEGDLKGAIKQYSAIVAKYKSNRGVAAMALVRMAECYQKMGDAESHKIYERVVKDYGDQKDAVALARSRLGKESKTTDSRMSFRQVWKLPDDVTVDGQISRDGRYLAYIDWVQNGDIFLRDLASDTNRRLTDQGTDRMPGPKVEQFGEETAFSRDGRQLAYSWFRNNRYELRVLDLKGDGIPQSRLLFDDPHVEWIAPLDWSPDGKSIAVRINRTDKTAQIGLVSAADGNVRVLKSVDPRGPSMLSFTPDGKYLAYDIPAGADVEQRDIFVLATDGSREIPAVVSPGQDTVVAWSNDGKRLLFASDRSGSVGLWSVSFAEGKVDGAAELLRRDIGHVSIARLTDADKLYAKIGNWGLGGDIQLATVDFAAGKLLSPASLAVQTYVGNNQSPVWSPDGKYMAYASRRGSVGPNYYVIAIRSTETGAVREMSPSPGFILFNSMTWALDGSLVVLGGDTKGRYGLFRVDAQTGRNSVLELTPDDGQLLRAVISADGKKLYYGKRLWEPFNASPRQAFLAWIEKDLATGSQKEMLRTFYGNLSPNGQYLATIEAPTKPKVLAVRPIGGGDRRELADDIGGPQFRGMSWAPDSTAIHVLKATGEIWRFPIDGSAPSKVDLKVGNNLNIASFGVHPDGRRIAFEARPAKQLVEIWMLENFLPTMTASK